MFQRLFQLPKNSSFFLFGPRGVGKSTLLKESLPAKGTYTIDLLDYDTESRLVARPAAFGEIVRALPSSVKWVVVDEIQKLPPLLNEVHRLIEENPRRHFALTGSSARKLKKGQANLLAGRAFTRHLSALTLRELGDAFNLGKALQFGTLPKVQNYADAADKNDFLTSYAQTYLREEIFAEGLVRNLPAFRKFLPLAAQANGQVLSYSNFANDTGVDIKTIRSYFEILEDTLIGFLLPAYHRSVRKRQKQHPKFFWFDTGVKRALAGELTLDLHAGSTEYGRAFEHFVVIELMRLNIYGQKDYQFSYLATHDMEIDLVLERPGKPIQFIEIKSTDRVRDSDMRALKNLAKDVPKSEVICICREPRKRLTEGVLVCPWKESFEVVGL